MYFTTASWRPLKKKKNPGALGTCPVRPLVKTALWMQWVFSVVTLERCIYDTDDCHQLHNLITIQPPRSTRSSSLVTLARPSTSSSLRIIGADSTGATGNVAPVLTQEPGQTLRFAPVPFMAVLWFFKWTFQLYLLNLTKAAKFAGSVGHPMTRMLSASGGFA